MANASDEGPPRVAANAFAPGASARGMDDITTGGRTVFALGLVATVLGALAYLAGIATAYPGRAFSVTAVMVGVTVLAIGNAMRGEARP